MKISFIGLGKLGLECAEAIVMRSSVAQVHGYDINGFESDYVYVHSSLKGAIRDSEFIFVAVDTPHHEEYDGSLPTSYLTPKDFDYTNVKNVLKDIATHAKPGQTVVLISTVLPGTCQEELIPLLPTTINFVYNPYLIAMGTTTWDMLNPEMVIIGTENKNIGEKLQSFYKSILMNKNSRFELCSIGEAECIKIFYNTFISFKLSFVNMIQDVAELSDDINCDVVANALGKSSMRLTSDMYMKPGMGDGGPCHPRDNIALRYLAKKLDLGYDLFDAIMTSREVQAKRLADKLNSYELPIVILGKSFKPGVPYEDGSYSKLVSYFCENVIGYDENVNDKPCTYLLSHRGEYHDFPFNKYSVILDIWGEFETKRDDITVIYYGRN